MHGYILKGFATYSEQLGYIWIHQWRPEDVREFRQYRANLAPTSNQDSATRKASTTRKDMSNLKTFFEFCIENRWIATNPARIKARRTRTEVSVIFWPPCFGFVSGSSSACGRHVATEGLDG